MHSNSASGHWRCTRCSVSFLKPVSAGGKSNLMHELEAPDDNKKGKAWYSASCCINLSSATRRPPTIGGHRNEIKLNYRRPKLARLALLRD